MFVVRALVLLVGLSAGLNTIADDKFYLGIGLGQYDPDYDADFSAEDDANVVRALAGYNLTDGLAIEVDYQRFAEVDERFNLGPDTLDVESEVESWGVALVPSLTVSEFVRLYAKAGYAWTEVDATVASSNPLVGRTSTSDRERAFTYGVGAGLQFGSLGLRAEVSRMDSDDVELDVASLNLTLAF